MGRGPVRVAALALFAAAMGWLEAVVVVYIRAIVGIAHGSAMPTSQQVMARFLAIPWLLPTEQGREAATMVMLATVAWLGASRLRQRLGAFLMIFGIWDIAYYVGLRILVGWPTRLTEMDLLFLMPPHPWWYQPVWVPVGISCVMIAAGARLLASDRAGIARRAS